MQTILVISKTFLVLGKGEYIDLYSATQSLKSKYNLYFDNESRVKQVIVKFKDCSLSVFSTGAIVVRSQDLVENEREIVGLKRDLKKFIFRK